ncbi:MAG: hypothetical protein KME59_21490 [Trichormus sp. ATA11-4-KO1]|nr:hypothetical protein [Trichormus sp. ATA11-4-KO1]
MHIKKLSDDLQVRVLGYPSNPLSILDKQKIENKLKPFGLHQANDNNEVAELPIPDNFGTLEQELEQAIAEHTKSTLDALGSIMSWEFPELPTNFNTIKGKWQYWCPKGERWKLLEKPISGKVFFQDTETVQVGDRWLPTCAVAMSARGWLLWVTDFDQMPSIIPYGFNNLMVNYNTQYDRAYLSSEYQMEDTGNRFFDLMSAWIICRGLSNQQRPLYLDEDTNLDWMGETATNSLSAVYEFFFNKPLDKGVRDNIVNDGLPWVRDNMLEVIRYCCEDVLHTAQLFKRLYPEYLNHRPSLVAQSGSILLGSCWLPLDADRFPKYYETAENMYQELAVKTNKDLMILAEEYLSQCDPDNLPKPALALDWNPAKSGKNKGLPAWYRKVLSDYAKGDLTLSKRFVPIVMGITWRGEPLLWDDENKTWYTEVHGWLPHPEVRGKNVTSVFAKGFVAAFEQGVLSAANDSVKQMLAEKVSTINWVSLRKRVAAIHTESPEGFPVTLPSLLVNGTITGRCADNLWQVAANPKKSRLGTELKSMVAPPKGYVLVGADIDSEEAWLAGIMGDSVLGINASTPMGFICVAGAKAETLEASTDIHSLMAKETGISRDNTKTRVYGCVPMDTQALTREGWRVYSELSHGTEILAYNAETGVNEWSPITHMTYHEDAEVYKLEMSHGWSVVCTGDHRWYGSKRVRKLGVKEGYTIFQIFTTDNIKQENNITVSAPYNGGSGYGLKSFGVKYGTDYIPEILKMSYRELQSFVLGVLLSDGHQDRATGTWCITQKMGHHAEAFKLAAYLIGYRVSVGTRYGNKVQKMNLTKPHITAQRLVKTRIENTSVWCPTTALGTWVMRQGDTITITGNCIYGQGLTGDTNALLKNIPTMTLAEAQANSKVFINKFKGQTVREEGALGSFKRYTGGLASDSFNVMESIADSKVPKTPLLKNVMSRSLAGFKDFKPSRVNWTIQSSGVDFRDMLILLTRHFYKKLGVDGKLLITIHDEIRTMVGDDPNNIRNAIWALQLAHLYVRAAFIDALSLDCIPAGVAWFSAVDVDPFCLRKDPKDPQITPSQPQGLPIGYTVTPSQLLSMLV